MRTLVFLLEEPSAKAMLEGLLPRVIPPQVQVRYLVFEGKQDLQKHLVRRLRHWQAPNSCFVILRDQDSEDCRVVRAELQRLAIAAGRPEALIRVACHELESFYLGDLAAVEHGLALRGLGGKQNGRKFRTPDKLSNASEELRKLTQSRYQKLGGSRAIGPHLRVDGSNRSRSFNVLLEGIRRLTVA